MFSTSKKSFNKYLKISALSAVVVLFNSCEAVHEGFTTSTNFSSEAPLAPVAGQKFTCQNTELRGLSEGGVRRLTRHELENTLRDLFGDAAVDDQQTISTLNLYNNEAFDHGVDDFTRPFQRSDLDGIVPVANLISTRVSLSKTTPGNNIFPSCITDSNNFYVMTNRGCVETFVRNLFLHILRRPVQSNELSKYADLLQSSEPQYNAHHEKVKVLINILLLQPDFLFHITHSKQDQRTRSMVDQYTVASRLSYRTIGSTPDAQLLNAAANNQLNSVSALRSHARRLLNSNRGRRHVRHVFDKWLQLHKTKTADSRYLNYKNISTNSPVNLRLDYVAEALDYVEYIVFERNGDFNELMTSQAAFPRSQQLAQIMGTSISQGINDPKFTSSTRKGLFMRPAFLVSDIMRTGPIARGHRFTTQMSCRTIPDPSPADTATGSQLQSQLDIFNTTSRQIAEHSTAPVSCNSCHQHINPPGYIFENFGPLGEERVSEAVFDNSGNYLRDLNIDTAVQEVVIDSNTRLPASGPSQFADVLSDSTPVKACVAQQMFRMTRLQHETAVDDCHIADVEALIQSGQPILEAFIQNAASEDLIWQRRF